MITLPSGPQAGLSIRNSSTLAASSPMKSDSLEGRVRI